MTAPEVLIHFGVHRVNTRHEMARFRGHSDPTAEKEFLLRDIGQDVIVSGSWGCWGPADQATDGDSTLHILARTDRFTRMSDQLLRDWLLSLFRAVNYDSDNGCRAYDFAVLTTEDHSDVIGNVLFTETEATIFGGLPVQHRR